MNKTIFFAAFLMLAGFCFAGGPPQCQYGDYFDERLDISWCMMGVGYGMADDIADFGGDGVGWDIYGDMADAREAMWDAAMDCNIAAFNAAYVEFMKAFGEMRVAYFYFGFMDGMPIGELWSMHSEYMNDLNLCVDYGYGYVYDGPEP